MKSLFSRQISLILVLSLLIPGTVFLAPSHAYAFGSLAENGTAAFMGIGINPIKILHVSGTGPGTVPLFQRGSDSAGFIIERTPTNRWVLGVNESPALGNGFVLSTIPTGNTSVPRLLVTPAGNVGIGTTNVDSNKKLQVETDSTIAVWAENTANSTHAELATTTSGVWGQSYSNHVGTVGVSENGTGVEGECLNGAGVNTAGVRGVGINSYGVIGTSTYNHGVYGTSIFNHGVYGTSVHGYAGYFQGSVYVTDNLSVADNLTVGTTAGDELSRVTVVNDAAVNGSKAVYAEVTHTGNAQAVYGKHADSGNYGYLGSNNFSVYGKNYTSGGTAVNGESTAGYGIWGTDTTTGVGVKGVSDSGYGVRGESTTSYGVIGQQGTGPRGWLGSAVEGVRGEYTGPGGPNGKLGTWNAGVVGSAGVNGTYGGYFTGDVYVNGRLSATGIKSFVAADPADPTKEIWYVALEGPEAGTYIRGSAELVAGQALIELPAHFAKVTADKGLTVQLTPTGNWLQLYVAEKSTGRILVREATGQNGSFDYFINGIRPGYEDFQVIRDREPAHAK